MADLRTCYTSRFCFYKDSPIQHTVHWYFVDRADFVQSTPFGSAQFDTVQPAFRVPGEDLDGSYPRDGNVIPPTAGFGPSPQGTPEQWGGDISIADAVHGTACLWRGCQPVGFGSSGSIGPVYVAAGQACGCGWAASVTNVRAGQACGCGIPSSSADLPNVKVGQACGCGSPAAIAAMPSVQLGQACGCGSAASVSGLSTERIGQACGCGIPSSSADFASIKTGQACGCGSPASTSAMPSVQVGRACGCGSPASTSAMPSVQLGQACGCGSASSVSGTPQTIQPVGEAVNNNGSGVSTLIVGPFTQSFAVGDYLVCAAWGTRSGSGVPTVTFSDSTAQNSWVSGGSLTQAFTAGGVSYFCALAYVKVVSGGSNIQLSVKIQGETMTAFAVGLGYTGIVPAGPQDGNAQGTTVSASLTAQPGSLTIQADDLVLTVAVNNDSPSDSILNAPSHFNVAFTESTEAGYPPGGLAFAVNPASPVDPQWSANHAVDWGVIQVALRNH